MRLVDLLACSLAVVLVTAASALEVLTLAVRLKTGCWVTATVQLVAVKLEWNEPPGTAVFLLLQSQAGSAWLAG